MKAENGSNGHGAVSNGSGQGLDGSRTASEQETIRLIIQALGDMGYNSAVETLSRESGINVESALVEDFRHAILEGDWSSAEVALHELELTDASALPVRVAPARSLASLTRFRRFSFSYGSKSSSNCWSLENHPELSSCCAPNCPP